MSFRDVVKAVAVPYALVLYGLVWISAQPFLVLALKLFDRARAPLYQVLSVAVYLVINAACLLVWYRITKKMRNRLLFRRAGSNR